MQQGVSSGIISLGTLINIPSKDSDLGREMIVDLLGGLAFGAEYFINDHFSLGAESQVILPNLMKIHSGSVFQMT